MGADMGHVTIKTGALPGVDQHISDEAAARVRMGFNPSAKPDVDRIKALIASAMTVCEGIRDANGPGAREAAVAITQLQGASMFAVAAATADL